MHKSLSVNYYISFMSHTNSENRAKSPYKCRSWIISDAFWERIAPLLPDSERDPCREYKRSPGAGRPPMDKRTVISAIFYVARTGIQWKALPKSEYGSPSSIHSYFIQWSRQGVFQKMWEAGLAEYGEMEGIAWQWQSVDGSMNKAPLALESVGRNPTDRGKNGDKAFRSGGRPWNPAFARRVRGQQP
jgi:transposase